MMHRILRVLSATLCAAALVSSAAAADVTFGNPSSAEANVFPFGGFYQDGVGGTEYQQVYLGSMFGGPFSVGSISFYNMSGAPITNADGTYVLSLSTTTAPVNGLDTNQANNIGANNTTIFNGALPATVPSGGLLTFTLSTPFNFNPAGGNLLLDVKMSGVTNDSSAGYAAQNGDFGGISSRMVNGNGTGTSGWGLVTTFTVGTAAVPEPTSLCLGAIGAIFVVAAARKHRRRNAA
jgi:hypothetical protein